MVGQTLAHYKILEKIGSGGMGDVYLAEDTKLDRKVALKVLPPDLAESEERRTRFQREAKALAALDHPNIVQVFSVEEADGTHFITMQLVPGKTLTKLLPKNGFPLSKFFEIAIPLADAVAAAHQEGSSPPVAGIDQISWVPARSEPMNRRVPSGETSTCSTCAWSNVICSASSHVARPPSGIGTRQRLLTVRPRE